MKIVQVTWRDSHRYMYQMDKNEDVSVITIKSIGFLVKKSRNEVVLAQDDIEGDIRGVIIIPKENILDIKVVQ